MGSKRVSVLVNPAAGGNRGLGRTKGLVAELADRGWTVDLLKASSAPEVSTAIKDATTAGMTRFVLAGGDGLVHHALPALVASPVVVGIVPVGTGNDFSRGLGLSSKASVAIDQAVSETVGKVDVISVQKGGSTAYVASVLTSGFSGRVNARANQLANRRGIPKGSSRYSIATVAEIAGLEPVPFSISCDDQPAIDIDASMVAIGNTPYFGGGMKVCPEANVSDGTMELVVIDMVSKKTFLRVLPTVFGGRHVNHPAVSSQRCRRLTITTTEPLWADGELLFEASDALTIGAERVSSTVECSVMPGLLNVAGVVNR